MKKIMMFVVFMIMVLLGTFAVENMYQHNNYFGGAKVFGLYIRTATVVNSIVIVFVSSGVFMLSYGTIKNGRGYYRRKRLLEWASDKNTADEIYLVLLGSGIKGYTDAMYQTDLVVARLKQVIRLETPINIRNFKDKDKPRLLIRCVDFIKNDGNVLECDAYSQFGKVA